MSETLYITKYDETYIHIEADRAILYELTERFTYLIPDFQFHPRVKAGYWDGKIRLFDMRNQLLYLGLHPYVKEWCSQNEYECVYNDPLDIENEFSVLECEKMLGALDLSSRGSDIIPYEYQQRAIIHAIQRGRVLLLSPTASGKSLMIYCLLRYFLAKTQQKVLVIVPTTALVAQMYDDFKDYATKIMWDAERNCHKVFDGGEKETDKPVVISTWQALAVKNRLTKEQRAKMSKSEVTAWNKKAKYKLDQGYFDQFGTVFGDEAHLFSADECTNLMSKLVNAQYRFGTTGTLKDAKTNQMILEGLFGQVYKTISTREMIDGGHASELEINCLQLQYSATERKLMKRKTYQEEMEFLITHSGRNSFIRNLALSLKGNTLVLFERVEKHGKVLHEMIGAKIAANRKLFYVHGQTETEDRNQIRHITEGEENAVIVASYGTYSTGVNIRRIHNIIFASPSKSKIRVLQSIGRGLRLAEQKDIMRLYDISDDLSTWNKAQTEATENYSMKHFIERLKYYNDERHNYKTYKIQLQG